jgi:AcrR family transcriptional regulator
MTDEKPYHHGDLRAALLLAAEVELATRGIEAFSLRAVAKRAGVSHAAPAHHFGDANGLLTALATEGYRQLLAAQLRREAQAAGDAVAQLVASGLGYIDFAMERPALFRLVFGSARPDHHQRDLQAAGAATYTHLTDLVFAAGGRTVVAESAIWAMAHGLADLLAAGRLKGIGSMEPAARDAVLRDILIRSLPGD